MYSYMGLFFLGLWSRRRQSYSPMHAKNGAHFIFFLVATRGVVCRVLFVVGCRGHALRHYGVAEWGHSLCV